MCPIMTVLPFLAMVSVALPPVTLDSLLRELVDVEAVARWPQPEYGRAGRRAVMTGPKSPPMSHGWFANDDHTQFLRSEVNQGRTEQVMLDADAPAQ